ncbi:hypothetical protein HE1_01168 [Holospora elegans E1]|uniref:Uncharacterized protein n=1 Tax=Holospora elegans E1 TaxID=1427503 RepID=A0A023DZ60_9PROT|nr:hypothetical protein [Holospora elegans]GAJ46826.1 hypothetical protein HE1_01168 [Holospora elegans E1]
MDINKGLNYEENIFLHFFVGSINQCLPLSGFCMKDLKKNQHLFEENKKEIEGYKTVRMAKEILSSGNSNLSDNILLDSEFKEKN